MGLITRMAQTLAVREFLRTFHRAHAGIVSRVLCDLHTIDDRTCYDVIADAVLERVENPRVLDLGCGDGTLLSTIVDRAPQARVNGIDLAEIEIDAARKKVPSGSFLCADIIDGLPHPNASFDVVVSNLVVMLLGDLSDALDDIARVLAASGRFAFVFDNLTKSGSSYERMLRAAMDGAGTLGPATRFDAAADPDLYDRWRLRSLLERHGFTMEAHEYFSVGAAATADSIDTLLQASYPIGLLDDDSRAHAYAGAMAYVERERLDRIELPLALCVAVRAQ